MKRTPINRPAQRLTPKAVELFKKIMNGEAGFANALCIELCIQPWEESPLEVYAPPPDWLKDEQLARWQRALALRRALLAAAEGMA